MKCKYIWKHGGTVRSSDTSTHERKTSHCFLVIYTPSV